MKCYVELMRPKQWIKNVFVCASLLFSKEFMSWGSIQTVIRLALYFIIISSTVYVFNDMVDVEEDRHHPKKKNRPLARGVIGKRQGRGFLYLLCMIAIAISTTFQIEVNMVAACYMLNNLAYSLLFKRYVIVDGMMIAIGFLLRVVAGALSIGVGVSSWILICTFFIAMLMALGKRRSEIICLEEKAGKHRQNLQAYSIQMLDYMLLICVACTIMTYSLYSILEQSSQFFLITIIFVFYGVIRYVFLLFRGDGSKMPEEIITEDKPLLLNLAIYGVSVLGILAYV